MNALERNVLDDLVDAAESKLLEKANTLFDVDEFESSTEGKVISFNGEKFLLSISKL
jgi:hypothetical protein